MIKRVLLALFLLIVVAVAAFVFWAQQPEIAAIAPPAARSFDPAVVARGAQLAAIGNCNTCHTTEGGAPFAGGRALPTPFGTIYATNITPDPDTGIGRWSLAAFHRSLRAGVDRAGRHLYPAFPYDHFTKLDDDDIAALYAFLMTRDPVRAEAKHNDLPFPLDNRLVIAGWKLLFLRSGPYRNDPAHDEAWNRGAYLVTAVAHCGACHTPRNVLGAEQRSRYFGGGTAEGWHAPALNAASPAPVRWTADALFAYLRDGAHADHGAAAGPMAPVTHNLARAPEADVRAIADYVAAVDNRPAEDARKATEAVTRAAPDGEAAQMAAKADQVSAAIFTGACANCHADVRQGPSGAINLALTSSVNGPDPRNAIRVVLDGIHPPEGRRGPIMPSFAAALTDQQIAGLLAYVRARFSAQPAWSNLEEDVRRIRQGGEQG
ncbi:MAG TPA: c-type cytochrome [Xanthobacteraceae bacterium]|nr:c-type cytochrome [Xanthobacteraceae bacterium]